MKVIGLCGGSGAGKGYVCQRFKTYKFGVIDTDRVYHGLLTEDSACARELVGEFGRDIILSGKVDRPRLAAMVFADKSGEMLKRLNEITHKHILARVRSMLSDYEEQGFFAVIVDAPLLFESGFDKECDFTVGVIADREIRMQRIIERDKITREGAETRINKQKSDEFILENCDFIIVNNGDDLALDKSIAEVAVKILENGDLNYV